MDKKIVIGIIGLGYVGLPIFARLKKNFKCIGFDIDKSRIRQLKTHKDYNKEFKSIELKEKNNSIYKVIILLIDHKIIYKLWIVQKILYQN